MGLPCGTYNVSYAKDMAIVRTKTQWIMLGVGLILLFCLPQFLSTAWLAVVNLICITLTAVFGLAIMLGYTGLISLGHSAFVGVGAYTAACIATKLFDGAGWSFWIAIPLAGIVAGVVGLAFGAPSLRVKGLYIALTTLAAQFILTWVFMHWGFLGGVRGIRLDPPSIGGITLGSEASWFYFILVVTLVMGLMAKNLVRTRVGRAFIAIRDNDIAASGMGIDIFRYKMLAFFIGCFFAGVAGAMWGYYMGIAHYEHFTLMDSVWYLGMVVIGGMGFMMGAVFGTLLIRLLTEATAILAPRLPIVGEAQAATLSYFVFGLVVVLFLILEPRGLAHRWEIFKASYRLWPFSY